MKKDWLKSRIQNGHQEAFSGSFLTVIMTHLPLNHHSVSRISPIVFILSEHVAKYDNRQAVNRVLQNNLCMMVLNYK